MLTILITIAIAGRLKSLRIALAIAFTLPFLILFMGAPAAALILRIPANLLAAFLSFKYYQRKRGNKNLETCREAVLKNLASILQITSDKLGADEDAWFLLAADTQISITAIKEHPNNIPVIVAALINVGDGSLGSMSQSPSLTKAEKKSLRRVQKKYAKNTSHAAIKLVEIHGHKITDIEAQSSMDIISSYKWDNGSKEFASKTS